MDQSIAAYLDFRASVEREMGERKAKHQTRIAAAKHLRNNMTTITASNRF